MNVPAMSLELHERGIHAVWTGGPGPRPGGTGVTGARQDPAAPETPKHQKTVDSRLRPACVRPASGLRPAASGPRLVRAPSEPRDTRVGGNVRRPRYRVSVD